MTLKSELMRITLSFRETYLYFHEKNLLDKRLTRDSHIVAKRELA